MEKKLQSFKDKNFWVIKGSAHPEYSYFTFEGEERDFRDKYWDIKENDVVFDVGASYGTYTLSALAEGATVYCFEPEKTVFCDLCENIKINNFEKCYVTNAGLWSSDTTINMKEYAPHWPQQSISDLYPATTLDNIVNNYNITKIDWLKIDVEGAEEHVVIGGLNSITKFKPNLIIECHTFLYPDILDKVKLLLSAINYEFEIVDRDPCVMLLGKIK